MFICRHSIVALGHRRNLVCINSDIERDRKRHIYIYTYIYIYICIYKDIYFATMLPNYHATQLPFLRKLFIKPMYQNTSCKMYVLEYSRWTRRVVEVLDKDGYISCYRSTHEHTGAYNVKGAKGAFSLGRETRNDNEGKIVLRGTNKSP